MPQPPQFSGSDEVSTQSVPQAVCVPEQVVPTIPPVPVVPPVPIGPPKVAFEQDAPRKTMPRPKIKARALVMTRRFPPGAKAIPRTPPFATRFWTRMAPAHDAPRFSAASSHPWRPPLIYGGRTE
jgi:hypothetical protein